LGKFIVAKYTEVEFLEWIENIPPDVENTVIVTSGQNYYTTYNYTVIPTLDNLSAEGWEVVSFTDTFNYLELGRSRSLQRRKCYLLKKEDD
jgi:hypothetical protein